MNKAERLKAIEIKAMAIETYVYGMLAENELRALHGNSPAYNDKLFMDESDKLNALADKLEKEATPVSQPEPRHPPDPLYKVGRVVISIGGSAVCAGWCIDV